MVKLKTVGVILLTFFIFLRVSVLAKGKESESWKKKHVTDYNDADLERLYEQWEEDDEPLEEDELPEWKRPAPKIDLSKIDPNDPEAALKMSKQGRTLMMFASLSGNPTEDETQEISQIWQTSLFNANVETQRYVVGQNRVLFMLKDGSKAWQIKDFLVNQDRCESVTIEGKDYYGKGSPNYGGEDISGKQAQEKPKKKKKEKEKKKLKSETDGHKKKKSSKSNKTHKSKKEMNREDNEILKKDEL